MVIANLSSVACKCEKIQSVDWENDNTLLEHLAWLRIEIKKISSSKFFLSIYQRQAICRATLVVLPIAVRARKKDGENDCSIQLSSIKVDPCDQQFTEDQIQNFKYTAVECQKLTMKIMNETLLGMSTFATSDEQLNCKYNACNLGMDFRFVVVSLKSALKIEMIWVSLNKRAVLVAIFLLRYFLCYSTNCYKLLLPQHSPDFTKNLNKKCEPLFHIQ